MPSYRRPRVPSATIAFTAAPADRRGDLLVREVARLRAAVAATRAERPFEIAAYVVLPDHLNRVWTLPEGDADDATRWRLIKSRFSMGLATGPRRASHVARGERGIWQRRYWEHHVRDERDLWACVRHCRINPVKHGLCERPEDWPHSSIHRDTCAGRYVPGMSLDP